MASPDNQSTATPNADFTKTWRYKVGLFMFIVGNLGVLAAMPVGLALGFGVATIGAVVVGSEVLATASIVFLGMQGFKALKNKIFGGEGLFYALMRGPGMVWMQTLPFSRLADRIYAAAPQGGGKDKGEGSVLGGVFDMLSGD